MIIIPPYYIYYLLITLGYIGIYIKLFRLFI